MRCYASIGNGETRDYPDVTIASSGLDVPVFNSAMLTNEIESLDPVISLADTHFKARKLGWTFWICQDLLTPSARRAGIQQVFRARSMRCIADVPGMYAERILEPVRSAAPLTFSRVKSESTRLDFAKVASAAFSLRIATSRKIYGSPGIWEPPCCGWVGYFEEKPVSIVTVVVTNDVAGIYSLGTLQKHQGRGFGETILRHALKETFNATGISRSVLQSTTQGMSLYIRCGYRVVTNFSIFLRESCAAF